ncbi:MAG: DUF4032 domain-containing protein [Bacteroidota bacterium]|jgi:hypothetical protein
MNYESNIRYHVDPIFRSEVEKLPWHVPISEWKNYGVNILDIKHGISRHFVIFVKAGKFSFGIKEISEIVSRKEVSNYEQLLLMGIHTLVPAGYVVREESPLIVDTPIGTQYESNNVAHTITLLVEKVLPDSLLYSRNFRVENHQKIWDAIVRLFVQLHTHGVYWGDASLANTLIRFESRDIPFVGKQMFLAAYLADAETVEIYPKLSKSMREADLNFFFESMEWIAEDLKKSGVIRDEDLAGDAQKYILMQYATLLKVERRKKKFEQQTSFSIDKFLGSVSNPTYVSLFLKHIEEHKWYMSERGEAGIALAAATQDWYANVFVPICELFRTENILDLFPGKTAAELYIEIMTNKYYLSKNSGTDIGMIAAMRDYAQRFGVHKTHDSLLNRISDSMLGILERQEKDS